jgi:hypothetical protein
MKMKKAPMSLGLDDNQSATIDQAIDREKLREFADGATLKTNTAEAALDPDAKPTRGMNLRLNDYQADLLTRVAKREGRSKQKQIMHVLMSYLEKAKKEFDYPLN